MKLLLDSKQKFQLEAIKAVTGIYKGQHLNNLDFKLGQVGLVEIPFKSHRIK